MKQLPRYLIADPAGNITVLVTDPVAMEEQASVAAALFSEESTCEQVGFLTLHPEAKSVSIRMSGGEFCGNATLSSAAYACHQFGLTEADISVDFYGIPSPLLVSVKKTDIRSYNGIAMMPMPENCDLVSLSLGDEVLQLPVVRLPGICHIIITDTFSREKAEKSVRQWCRELDSEALGLMLLQEDRLTPVVYVRDVDSLYWEHSCASGTCAAAYYLYCKTGKNVSISFREPGGFLSAEAGDGFLRLIGNVNFPALS